jgi:uncharacterized protein involved in response to NO
MIGPTPRFRSESGPAVLSYGFRPFFLLGALYSGLAVLAWLPMVEGALEVWTSFAPRDWHAHEMLYGYLPAVITGFLLTAIPNWTGRLPLQGAPLLGLVLVWVIGRISVALSAVIGAAPAALLDLAFLALVAVAAAREIIAGSNWRNLKVLVVLGVLFAGNAIFHAEALLSGVADYGIRIGLAGIVGLIMLIGGRIIPSFTRNWLVRQGPGRLPAAFGRFDMLSMAIAALALVLWVIQPLAPSSGFALWAAGLLHTIRLARWAGDRTIREPLVGIMHVAYSFVPLGFALLGGAALIDWPASAGLHSWSAGAAGIMTLAVMSRASLGHTGRKLAASAGTQTIYALAIIAALTRIWAAFDPEWSAALMLTAGLAWSASFLGFAVCYWGILAGPRLAK